MIGCLAKSTEAILVGDFLAKDAEVTYNGAITCDLFDPIKSVDDFVFMDISSEYYFCITDNPWAYAVDEFGRAINESLPDPITVSVYSDGNLMTSWIANYIKINDQQSGVLLNLSGMRLTAAQSVSIEIQYLNKIYTSQLDINSNILDAVGYNGIYLQRFGFDSFGNIVAKWAKIIGSTIITVEFWEDILFHGPGIPGTNSGNNSGDWIGNGDGNINSQSLFIVKHDHNSNLLWGFEANSNAEEGYFVKVRGTAVEVDENGNIYLAGDYSGGVTLGSTTLEGSGGFIIKFDPDGTILWVIHIYSEAAPQNITITAMCLDNIGGLYITGNAMSYTNFNGMIWDGWMAPPNNASQLFITKFNTDGEPQWVEFARTDNRVYEAFVRDMAVDVQGNIYISGKFNGGALYFDEQELTPEFASASNNIIFVVSYDSNGQARWAQMTGDDENPEYYDDDVGSGITIDALGNCFITGSFTGTIVFGEDTLTSQGFTDSFMVQVSSPSSTGIEEITKPNLIKKIDLSQNFPNPFSQNTSISYSITNSGLVSLVVYDIHGKILIELVNEEQIPGEYAINCSLESLIPGVYFYQLRSGDEQIVKKMVKME